MSEVLQQQLMPALRSEETDLGLEMKNEMMMILIRMMAVMDLVILKLDMLVKVEVVSFY